MHNREMEVVVRKDGKAKLRRRLIYKWKNLYRWIALGVVWNFGLGWLSIYFKFNSKWVEPLRWVGIWSLWYWQCWSYDMRGIQFELRRKEYQQWDIIEPLEGNRAIIYGADYLFYGKWSYKMWRIHKHKWRWLALLEVFFVKLMVKIKIIK